MIKKITMSDTIYVVAANGERKALEFNHGDSLMEVLRDAGYDEIMALCGGCCSCATCHVKIADQSAHRLPPIEENEAELLSMADGYDPESSRLSCQIYMGEDQQDMIVSIVAPE